MRELLAYSQGAVIEEKLTLRIKADNNGDIYLPVAGYSSDGIQDCDYGWMVSIDGNNAVEYSGLGSSSGKIRVGYGLSPLSVHTVIIKPKEENYGWLRAFGYKGTDIASSLINIISDKSYMGYALSELFTGDYYKAYQYYGCSNLINTDEELLPETLEIIGNNYRYYEYAGCSSLVHNAEEKILKTVKVIGDNYRAYQYQNCVGIKRIDMRAINWASVGNNYRQNQFDGMATDRNPVEIYIEGGIEEGGDWGLVNSRVKGIYVYQGLVSDYQTKLSTITSSKIKKNADWDNLEYEFIEYIGLADSTGKIRIPVGGYSTSGSQNCAYDWLVSIDGGEAEEITGTGSATYVSVGSGLASGSEYRIVIKPKTIGWGWGRAFGFYNTLAQNYIKEIIHDSYKCYASNRIETGNYYKYCTYKGCINLINSYEKLPTSVTTVGDYYMKECYAGCTGLKTAFWEVVHYGASIGTDYRSKQYIGCSAMEIHQGIAGTGVSGMPTGYRDLYLSGAGNNLDIYITRSLFLTVSTNFYSSNKYEVTVAGRYIATGIFNNTSNQGTTYGRFAIESNGTSTDFCSVDNAERVSMGMYGVTNASVGDKIYCYTYTPGYGSGNIGGLKLRVMEQLGIEESNLNKVYCYIDDVYDVINGLGFSSSKVGAYYYGYTCYEFKDVDKYTKLVASIDINKNPYVSQWGYYGLSWGIAINRKKNFNIIAIAATQGYGNYGSGDDPQALILGYNLSKPGDLSTIPQNYSNILASRRSAWSGSNYTFVGGHRFSRMGGLIYNDAYNGSNYDWSRTNFKGSTIGTRMGGGDITKSSTGVSDNGMFIWGVYGRYRLGDRENPAEATNIGSNGMAVGISFSNDGLKMYAGYETIKEYSLPSPRDTNNRVDTGRTLSIGNGGSFDISVDGKYLFVYRDGTIYQYTYEE